MKKLLSILLVLVLCTGLMAMTVSAEEGGYAMTVSSHELKEGTKEVTVTVTFTENAGVGSLDIKPVYDEEILKLTSIKGEGLPNEGIDFNTFTGSTWMASDTNAVWFSMGVNSTYVGNVVTMVFEVLQEVDTVIGLKYAVTDADENTVEFVVTDGSIKFICLHKTGTDAVETPATCDEAGKIEYVCKKCGEVTDTKTIAALGHTKGEAVTENEIPATCETAGSKDTVVYCTVCDKEISRKTETIPAIGHKWDEGKVTGEAKCGETGEVTYTCQNDPTHTKTETVAALEHAWGEGEVTTAPTCTEKGVKTYTCTRGCGETKTEEVAALGHTEGETVKENEVAPTCTVEGSYDEVVYCSVCGVELSRKTVTVKATGHDWDEGVVTVEPTCTKEGEKLHNCKNGCGETMTSVVEKAKHTVKEGTVEADDNLCIYTCAVCNQAVEHTHDKAGLTTSEDGKYLVGTCAHCGGEVKFTIPPSGDITPMLIMGGVAVFSMLAAAAYVTCRKFAK